MISTMPKPALRASTVAGFALGAVAGFALARAVQQFEDAHPGFELLDPDTWPDDTLSRLAELATKTPD